MSATLAIEQLPDFIFGLKAERHRAAGRSRAFDFLRLLANQLPSPAMLAFEARRRQLAPWGDDFATAAAAAGFALDQAEPLRLACVSCGFEISPDARNECDFSTAHRMACQLRRLRGLCSPPPGPAARQSIQTRRLKSHLRFELASSKATVAREFTFDDDVICAAMAHQFLDKGEAFKDAGELVDMLTNLTLDDQSQMTPFVEGMAELAMQLTPPPVLRPPPLLSPANVRRAPQGVPSAAVNIPPASQSIAPATHNVPPAPLSIPPATHNMPPAPQSIPPATQSVQLSPKSDHALSHSDHPPESKHSLRRETEALLRSTKCKVCRQRDLHFVAMPCGHFVFCEQCERNTKRCPVCQEEVTAVIRTYRS